MDLDIAIEMMACILCSEQLPQAQNEVRIGKGPLIWRDHGMMILSDLIKHDSELGAKFLFCKV